MKVPVDSASGKIVIFFALFVGLIATAFIIWLVIFRETGMPVYLYCVQLWHLIFVVTKILIIYFQLIS